MACVPKISPIVTPPSRLVKGFNPSGLPKISSLSTSSYTGNTYGELVINGENFFPFGSTYVTYNDIRVDVIYNSSFSVTIILPIQIPVQFSGIDSLVYPFSVPIRVINIESKFQNPPIKLISNNVYLEITAPTYTPPPLYELSSEI